MPSCVIRVDTRREGVLLRNVGKWWLVVLLTACGEPGGAPNDPEIGSTADSDPLESNDPQIDPPSSSPDDGADDASDSAIEPEPDVDAGNIPDVGSPSGLALRAVSPERGPSAGGTEILILGFEFTTFTEVYLGGLPCEDIDVVDESKITCRTPAAAPGLVAVKVVVGADQATLENAFEYLPPLVFEAIEPDVGPTRGGMPAVVRGEGFSPDTQISIGGRTALALEWIDDTTMRLLTPPGEVGRQVVRASDVHGYTSLEAGFAYVEPPRIDRIRPGAGGAAGGAEVELLGAGFDDVVSVHFGFVEAELVGIESGRLQVSAPPGPANQAVDVTVTTAHGAWTATDGFYYWQGLSEPALLNVSPARGPATGGTNVVISGIGLGDATEVRFGAVSAELVEVHESWVAVLAPPVDEPRVVNIAVELPTGWLVRNDAFEYVPAVAIERVEPFTGDVSGGNIVRVFGSGFESGLVAELGPLRLANVRVVGPGELTGVAPPGAPGPADLRIRSVHGVEALAEGAYTYTAVPAVHGFEPVRGSWAGGTRVVIRGRALLEPVEVSFGGVPAPFVEWLDPSTVAAWTPPAASEAFVDVAVQSAGTGWMNAPGRFLYFDPQSPSPGVWGESIAGAVNVTVVSDRGALLSDAFVMLGVRNEPAHAGYTDSNGQVTLSAAGVDGPQTVSASRPGFSAAVMYEVPGENVTLALRCAHDGPCSGDGDCRLGMICPDGACVDPSCAGSGSGGQPSPIATITGELDGLDKIGDPGPDEFLLAAIYTTTEGPWSVGTVRPTSSNVLLENGTYTLPSRPGALAVVAVCGMYNNVAQTFRPIRLGVARGLFLAGDQVATVDLTCDIWMDATLSVKVTDSPLGPSGPTIFRHLPIMALGSDGYFGGIVLMEGTDEVLSAPGFAPIEGILADASYTVRGGAFTASSWPYSITVLEGIRDLDRVAVLPPFVTVAHLTTPLPDGTEPMSSRFIEWSTPTDRLPDIWRIQMRDYGGTTWWDVVVPGEVMRVNLPDWPGASEVGLFPSGPMFTIFRGLDAEPFDLGDYDEADLAGAAQGRFSISAFTIVNP